MERLPVVPGRGGIDYRYRNNIQVITVRHGSGMDYIYRASRRQGEARVRHRLRPGDTRRPQWGYRQAYMALDSLNYKVAMYISLIMQESWKVSCHRPLPY